MVDGKIESAKEDRADLPGQMAGEHAEAAGSQEEPEEDDVLDNAAVPRAGGKKEKQNYVVDL